MVLVVVGSFSCCRCVWWLTLFPFLFVLFLDVVYLLLVVSCLPSVLCGCGCCCSCSLVLLVLLVLVVWGPPAFLPIGRLLLLLLFLFRLLLFLLHGGVGGGALRLVG